VDLLKRQEAKLCVEPPGALVARVGACRAERLDLQQLNAFRDQVGLKRLDESAADTPAVQSAVSRNQVVSAERGK